MPGAYLKPAYIQLPDSHWPGSLVACLVTQSSDSHHSSQSCRACCQCIQLKSSSLSLFFTATLQSGFCSVVCGSPRRCGHSIIVKYLNVLIKFTVSGRSKQTNKQAYTHVRNAVTVVWGSLRLAPISEP